MTDANDFKSCLKKEKEFLEEEKGSKLTKAEYGKMYRNVKIKFEPDYYLKYNKYDKKYYCKEYHNEYYKKNCEKNREKTNLYQREHYKIVKEKVKIYDTYLKQLQIKI
jgi:hypothetical protein